VPTPHHTGDIGPIPWWVAFLIALSLAAALVVGVLRAKGEGESSTWN
jgi:hypothetical protein